MTLSDRLRDQIPATVEHHMMEPWSTMIEAADEIERLHDALTFYATGEWADGYPGGVYVDGFDGSGMLIDTGETARAAINAQNKEDQDD